MLHLTCLQIKVNYKENQVVIQRLPHSQQSKSPLRSLMTLAPTEKPLLFRTNQLPNLIIELKVKGQSLTVEVDTSAAMSLALEVAVSYYYHLSSLEDLTLGSRFP